MEKNKGKTLEVIVSELERALSDNSNTRIFRNHKLFDRDGFEREIDIYVETEVNRKILRYAIECKNFGENSSVKMKDIDDFYSKISNQGLKGIFLTSGKFQANAIEKANKLNIELYTIEEDEVPLIQRYSLIHKRFEILNLSVGPLPENLALNHVYLSERKEKWAFEKFATKFLKPKIEDKIEKGGGRLFQGFFQKKENAITFEVRRKKEVEIYGELLSVFYKLEDAYYPIPAYRSNLEIWIEYFEENVPKTMKYKSWNDGKTFANFFSKPIAMNNGNVGVFNIIQVDGNDDLKFSVVTGLDKNAERIDLIELGTIELGNVN